MAIAASSVLPSNSLEEFRIEFNNLVSDVTGITSTNTFSTAIVFEGSTADAYETTLTLTDPTADRTITLPNVTGNVTVSGNPVSADGEALGSASLEWSDLYIADGGVIYFGDDQDVTITHDPDDGLFFKSIATADNNPLLLTLQTGETYMVADEPIVQIHFQVPDEASGTDAILVCAGIEAVAEGAFSSSSNATKLSFSTGNSAAAGTDGGLLEMSSSGKLTLKDLATADGSSATITLQSGDTDIAANDVLGAIYFQAPDEGAGTDAIEVAGGIECVSAGDFSSSNNATKISFKVGSSEAATEKAKIVGSTGYIHATPTAILLIKDSGGSTLATINGISAI